MSSVSQRLSRAVRHWKSSAADARRAFPPESLAAIGGAITEGERTHRGELRLVVEASMPFDAIWADMSSRQRALAMFAEHGVWDTEDNCGVLIYVNLAERKVEIVGDRNVNRKIDAATWQAVCRTMTEGFKRGQFHDSTLTAVAQVNELLRQHFPADGARANELPDAPILM
jgi:uncharacterized membrane protein